MASGTSRRKPAAAVLGTLLIIVTSFVVLFPLYWMAVTALKKEGEIFAMPPSIFPIRISFENFLYTFTQTQVPRYFLNSIINVMGTLAIALIFSSMAAYSISRFKFRFKTIYIGVILLTQLMPLTTLIVPLYVSLGSLRLLNNRFALIIVYCAIFIPVETWLLLGYFNTIPREIDEAARIDGCNNLMILFRMILPLSKPGLMAVGLTTAISVWQELVLSMTFNNTDATRPLMAGVSVAITRSGIRWGQMTATGIIVCVPVIIMYIFCQRYLVKGLTSGTVKG
jgi:ABC-type glycerol-3-phosphate transport system permease component